MFAASIVHLLFQAPNVGLAIEIEPNLLGLSIQLLGLSWAFGLNADIAKWLSVLCRF